MANAMLRQVLIVSLLRLIQHHRTDTKTGLHCCTHVQVLQQCLAQRVGHQQPLAAACQLVYAAKEASKLACLPHIPPAALNQTKVCAQAVRKEVSRPVAHNR